MLSLKYDCGSESGGMLPPVEAATYGGSIMKRVMFWILVMAGTWLPAPALAQTRSVEVQNQTYICYTVKVQGFGSDGQHLDIGDKRIDSKKSHTFTYSYDGKSVDLLVSADACFHGVMPSPGNAKNARVREVFSIEQPGQNAHIVRRP